MKRLVITLSIGASAILIFAVLAGLFLFKTTPGQSLLIDVAEHQIGDATNSIVQIGNLSGNLPSDLFLENITFRSGSGDDQPWLEIGTLHLAWQPLALFRKRLAISDIVVVGAHFRDMPPASATQPRAPKGVEIPTELPFIAVETLSFSEINIADTAFGTPAQLSGTGSLNLGGRDIKLALKMAAAGAANAPITDDIRILIDRVAATDILNITMALSSTDDGLLTGLANTNGPITITANGMAPTTDFSMTYEAALGRIGTVSGTLEGDLEKRDAINLDAIVALGHRLKSIRNYIGTTLNIDTTVQLNGKGTTITLNELNSEIASLTGHVTWQNQRSILKTAALDASLSFSDAANSTLHSVIGQSTDISATLERGLGQYAINAEIDGAQWRAEMKDGKTDLQNALNGPVLIHWTTNPDGPLLAQTGGSLGAALLFQRNTHVKLDAINGTLNPDASATGNASIDLTSNVISARLDIKAPEKTLNALSPSVDFATDLLAKLSVNGALENFAVSVSGDTPAISLPEGLFDAHRLDLSINGLPKRPVGILSLISEERGANLKADIDTDADGAIHLKKLNYTGPGFDLTGDGHIHPSTGRIVLATSYHGMPTAEPFPGFPIAGSFNVAANIEDIVSIDIQSRGLRTPLFLIQNAAILAEGPMTSIATSITAERLNFGKNVALRNLTSRGVVSHTDRTDLLIEALSVTANTIPVALTSPARLSIGETISIADVRASIDEDGTLAIDANISPERWTATVRSENLPLLDSGSALDLSLALDTDQPTLATGTIALASTFVTDSAATISAQVDWRDDRIHLRNRETTQDLSLDITIPAVLSRQDRLHVTTDGALDGAIRYDGQIEPLAAFLPVSLQALEGAMTADIELAGTLDAPSVNGTFDVEDAAYTDNITGFSLIGIAVDGTAASSPTGSSLRFNAAARGPNQTATSITAQGMIDLGDTSSIDMTLSLNEAALAAEPVSSMIASGDLSVAGALDALRIDGALTVDELNLETKIPPSTGLVAVDVVTAQEAALFTPVDQSSSEQNSVPLSLTLRADDRIFVRGRGMESEWRANINITGTTATPLALGELAIKKGYIDFADRRFDITRGKITFDRLTPNNPTLDIRAEATANDVTAAIVIKGRGEDPAITLESTPSLPNNDILAYVLFGEPANELNSFEALQVAQALASLGAIGPFGGGGPLGSARKAIGLDLLSLDAGSSDAAASLTVGKYVADGLFVSATQDARGENGSIRVEYEIRDSITVETEIRQDGDQTVSANWKRDF